MVDKLRTCAGFLLTQAATRRRMRCSALLVVFFLLSHAAAGATSAVDPTGRRLEPAARSVPARPSFGHLTVEQGLSDQRVWSLLQDQAGYIWIGTSNGLNRYDGYDVVVYRHDDANPASLSGNGILALFEDRKGTLWVGTRSGLNAFDPRSEQFTHYLHDPADPASLGHDVVQTIHEDSAGNLWIGTVGGLDRFDRASKTFTHFRSDPTDPHSLSNDTVNTILEDRTGMLWLGTRSGLNRFDPATGAFTVYRNQPDNPHSLGNDTVYALLEDRRGTLWIGTDGSLNQYDRDHDRFTSYRHDAAAADSLGDDRIATLFEDTGGALWIGTFGSGGISVLDADRQAFTSFRHDPSNPDSLGNDQISALIADRSGLLWIGTQGNGVDTYNPQQEAFTIYRNDPAIADSLTSNRVSAILEDRQHRLWVGTQNRGLDLLDRRSGRVVHYAPDPANPLALGGTWVSVIRQDQTDAIWVGTIGGGVYRLDPASGVFQPHRHDDADPGSLTDNNVIAMHIDRAGIVWIGTTAGGLNRIDPISGALTAYRADPNDPTSLSSDAVWAIDEHPDGTLWVGTLGGGVNLLDPATGSFTRLRHQPADPSSLSDDNVYAIHVDRSGVVWVGTFGGGLNRFNPDQRTFTRYHERDGLASDKIISILEDSANGAGAGNLWLATGRGITKLDGNRTRFRSYDATDGLPRTELTRGAAVDSSGNLLMGGFAGLIAVNPGAVRDDAYVPPIAFTELLLANRPVSAGETSVLPQAIGHTDRVTLSYADRVVSVKVAALSYRAPQQNRYRYMLEGFDTGWTEVDSTRRVVTYTNLDPGQYTLRVQASNADGVWNQAGRALALTIVPPWWQTTWFRIAAALALLAVVAGGYRWRTHALHSQARRLESQVVERTAQLTASAAQLRESEGRYRSLVDHFPGGAVFLFDQELRLLIAGGHALETLEYRETEVEGKLLGDVVSAEQAAKLEPLYRAILAGTAPNETEVDFNGRLYRLDPVSITNADGVIVAGMLIAQDVTERHVYETAMVRLNVQLEQRVGERTAALTESLRALNDSRRFGNQVAATSPALLLVFDLQSEQLVYTSRDPFDYFGLSASPSANGARPIPAAIRGEHGLLRGQDMYLRLRDSEVVEYEAAIEPATGRARWYAVRASAFRRDDNGQVAQVLVAALDITGRRRMEDELRAFQRQLIQVQDAERAHIARELHDQIGQLLTGLNLTLAAAGRSDTPTAAQLIGRAQRMVSDLTGEVRRLSVALRPAMLDDLGLLPTLAWHAQQFEDQTGVRVTLEHDGLDVALPAETSMAVFRVAQEALTNVARHAGVDAATVRLWQANHELHLHIDDRGQGFDADQQAPAGSSGLRGMRERIQLLGGTLAIDSRPGAGTTVCARLPLDDGSASAHAIQNVAIDNSENNDA